MCKFFEGKSATKENRKKGGRLC